MHCVRHFQPVSIYKAVSITLCSQMADGSVCLVMIVKNEAAIITRALSSVWDIIDAYCIVDTGSTDDTREVIAQFAADRPKSGVVVCDAWVNFGENRTRALQFARSLHPGIGWLWMMDADDFYDGPRDAATGALQRLPLAACADAPGVVLQMQSSPEFSFQRCCVFRRDIHWKYVGVLHEYPAAPECSLPPVAAPAEFRVQARSEGMRSKDPLKYANDATALETALVTEPDNMRYVFYCAQSFRDAGQAERAIPHYLRCATSTAVWLEERYISYLNLVRLETDLDRAIQHAWAGIAINPQRREIALAALYKARKHYAEPKWRHELLAMGMMSLRTASKVAKREWLFVEANAYGWSLYDEVGLAAFYLNLPAVALAAFKKGLDIAPDASKPHLQANIDVTVRLHPALDDSFKI